MREIKFRAWWTPTTNDFDDEFRNPRMIYFDRTVYNSEYNLLGFSLARKSRNPDGGDYDNLGLIDGVEEFSIMQYTGLKDKNGKEIYEGDIVNYGGNPEFYSGFDGHNYTEAVEYDEQIAGFVFEGGHRFEEWDWLVVIGNIYENPELLEAK